MSLYLSGIDRVGKICGVCVVWLCCIRVVVCVLGGGLMLCVRVSVGCVFCVCVL